MITRLSKIARLPSAIREQLNRRLHNGEIGRTILPWLNELPETKLVLAELFEAKPVTHQNLSEWRHSGYQDWLRVQQRLEWYDSLTEQEAALKKSECADGYEAMGSIFLFEIGQALAELQSIKKPERRWARLESLTREFARLQNAFNWSRRVHLERSKYQDKSPQPIPEFAEEDEAEEYFEDKDQNDAETSESDLAALNNESENAQVPSESLMDTSPSSTPELLNSQTRPTPGAPASRRPVARENASIQTSFQPIPTSAPTPQPLSTLNPQPPRPHISPVPIRGRRFVCIEG
ncbi:MAG TPA: hypothetical protein VG938_13460 [Verrucomicrobiae bacterium]|jgi:hypothetical protein|nr:hypothetical protein [Verrucomicrobiae bacterium]